MASLTRLSLVAALTTGCADAAGMPHRPTPVAATVRIVALGDSLTSGHRLARDQAYPAVLERTLRDAGLPFSVVNHGVSGDTTADAVRRLPAALGERPAILIVALGANDGLRGVPVSQVRANLAAIIEAAQALDIQVLLCGMDALPIYGWEYTLQFHRLFEELAATYDVPLVPFILRGVFGNQAMLLPDMVHPNAAGAAQIATNIWPYLQPLAMRVAAGAVATR